MELFLLNNYSYLKASVHCIEGSRARYVRPCIGCFFQDSREESLVTQTLEFVLRDRNRVFICSECNLRYSLKKQEPGGSLQHVFKCPFSPCHLNFKCSHLKRNYKAGQQKTLRIGCAVKETLKRRGIGSFP